VRPPPRSPPTLRLREAPAVVPESKNAMVEAGLFRVCRPATGWRLRTQPSHPVRYGHCGVAGAPLRRLDSDGDRRASLLPRRSGRARAGGGFGDRHGGLVLGTPAWQQAESSALTWYAFAGQVTVGFSVTFRAWRPRTNCQRHDLRGYRRDASPPYFATLRSGRWKRKLVTAHARRG
jgi:hypothetical protein